MDRIVSARVEAQRWYMRYPRAMPVGIFVLTMAVTVLSVFAIERVETERAAAQSRAMASAISAALERRANSHTAYLRAGAILLTEPEQMTMQRFHEFASQIEGDEEYRGGEGISWAARVDRGAIPAFEAQQRAAGMAGYSVHPALAAGQPFAVPVTLIGDLNPGNRIALGFDMYSDPVRRAAMDEAAREGRPVATGKVALVMSGVRRDWTGFLIYMPVFAPERGHRRLLGYLCTPFNARAFLQSALELAQAQAQGLGVRLYDGTPAASHLLASVEPQASAENSLVVPVAVTGQRFTLMVEQARSGALSTMSLLTLLFGIMVAALLMALARLMTQQAAEDRASLAWLSEQASIRTSLTRELTHRVKNTLANVLSIIALTRRRASDLDEFVESLTGRIRALSATHDLLVDQDWGQTPVAAVIAVELAPYTRAADHAIELGGPDVKLAPGDALSLGLAVHELATNASKYGALSVPSGRIEVRWERVSHDLLRVSWRESGGPPVPAQRSRGFGTELIEKLVAHELGHAVKLRFDPEGVRCELVVPVRLPAAFQIRAPREARTAEVRPPGPGR